MLCVYPILGTAIAFYVIYPVGIAAFAVSPALRAGSGLTAVGYGLLFGLLAYATYNLTNMSTVRGWSPVVTVVDTAWGAAVTGAAAPALTITDRTCAADEINAVGATERARPSADHVIAAQVALMPEQTGPAPTPGAGPFACCPL